MSKGVPGSTPGSSVLEELWNRGSIKADTYPQLIRNLQRERNTFRELHKAADSIIKQQEKEILRLRTLVVELGEAIKFARDQMAWNKSMTGK